MSGRRLNGRRMAFGFTLLVVGVVFAVGIGGWWGALGIPLAMTGDWIALMEVTRARS